MQGDDALQIVGQFRPMLRLAARKGVAGYVVGVGQVVDLG